jgi:hypothetical protein
MATHQARSTTTPTKVQSALLQAKACQAAHRNKRSNNERRHSQTPRPPPPRGQPPAYGAPQQVTQPPVYGVTQPFTYYFYGGVPVQPPPQPQQGQPPSNGRVLQTPTPPGGFQVGQSVTFPGDTTTSTVMTVLPNGSFTIGPKR